MTKEELIRRIKTDEATLTIQQVDEFFSQNVVIARGKSPHPYADVLHEYAEDTTKGLEYKQSSSDQCFYTAYMNDKEYRIKPSEPIYEYQWVCQEHKDTEYFVPVGWHTFEELQPSMYSLSRLEETKRVRQ